MPTLVPYLDSPNPTALKPDAADYEPDDLWKHQLKKRIEESLQSMVKDVKESQAAQLRKEVVTPETRMRLEEEYKLAMANIKALANDQYLLDLDRERNQRRWLSGAPVDAEWGRILAEEQQNIMNTIKNNQDDKPSSPTDERNPPQPTKPEVLPRESTKTLRSASLRVLDPKEERDKPSSSPIDPPPSARRGSDAKATLSRDREDRSRSRRHHSTSHSRGALPDDWDPPGEKATKDSDQPEEPHRLPPPPRSRPPAEQPPSSPESTRRDTLQGRSNSLRSGGSFTARSPPKHVPEVWKPAATAEDEPSVPKSYDLGRRGSSASMKSTASGTGVRPIISATIPERIDDADGPSPAEPPNHEQDKTRKHHDRERRGGRKNSRPTPVEPPIYADDVQMSSSLRSAGTTSLVMQMATSSTPVKALSSKPSFASAEDRYHRDQHPFPRDPPPPREPSYPSRDIPSNARSGHVRPSYGADERDYGGPYQPSQRPPKTPFRDYPSAPHQLYEERRRDRDREEWDHDLDDDYGREYERRDWDRDPYPESRHHGHYPYSNRSATYPTPTTSAARHSAQDYGYDDREAPTRGYGYRGHVPASSPPDEWDYLRPDSTRPAPTRQPSYRRDDPERDLYSRTYPSTGGVPIATRHAPSSEDLGGPAWKEWGLEARRTSDSRHEGHARSPAIEQFSRRRHRHYNGDLPRDDASFPVVRHRKRLPRLADGRDYDHDRNKESDSSPSGDDENDYGHSETDESEADMSAQAKKLEEDRKLANERIQEKAAEIQRLQEVEKRLEEEAKKKEEGLRLREETFKKQEEAEERRAEEEARKKVEEMAREAKKKEEELRKKNREAQRKEQEAKRKAEDAKKLVLEAGRKEEEARKKEEEIRRMEEEIKEEAEKAKQLQREAARQAEAARLKQEALRRQEEETRRKEQEIEAREHALRVREEELKIREEEAQRREEEAWRKDEEARKKEAEVKRKEQEARRREEEVKRKEEGAKKKEEEARRQEEETKRREQEALEEKVRQDARRMQDPERFFDDLDDVDSKVMEEQTRLLQQAQYRKREEEIKRNREERKRQDSVGNESAWAAPSSSPGVAKPFPQFTPAPQYSAPSPSPSSAAWTTWGSPPPKVPGSATLPNGRSASSSTVPPPLNKPRNGSVSSGSHPTSTSPHSATPITESEWARRHAEFTNNQQAKFRREQEKLEAERQLRAAGKPLTRDEVSRLMEHHDRLWTRLPTIHDLTWTDFPWPVLRTTMNADDITLMLVSNYFQSPLLPDKDKSRSPKERIKEHLRRWHPDRFESKVLPRVLESEKEKVKHGAGNVVRCLNDLLRKENESGNAPSPFGE